MTQLNRNADHIREAQRLQREALQRAQQVLHQQPPTTHQPTAPAQPALPPPPVVPPAQPAPQAKSSIPWLDWHVPRNWLDDFVPIIRVLMGSVFVAYSSISTIFLMAGDLEPLLGDAAFIVPWRHLAGTLAALVFFVGQTIAAERWPHVYWGLLVPDVFYTARSMALWMPMLLERSPFLLYLLVLWAIWWFGVVHRWHLGVTIPTMILVGLMLYGMMWATTNVEALGSALPVVAFSIVWAASLTNGYLVARFGEVLLFGNRRKRG